MRHMKWVAVIGIAILMGIVSTCVVRDLLSENDQYRAYLPPCSLQNIYTEGSISCSDALKGSELLLVHFWSTTCPSCIVELPELIGFTHAVKDKNVKVLYVAMMDTKATVDRFMKRNKLKADGLLYTVDLGKDVASKFGTSKIPETYLYSKKGILLKKYVGGQVWNIKLIQKFLP